MGVRLLADEKGLELDSKGRLDPLARRVPMSRDDKVMIRLTDDASALDYEPIRLSDGKEVPDLVKCDVDVLDVTIALPVTVIDAPSSRTRRLDKASSVADRVAKVAELTGSGIEEGQGITAQVELHDAEQLASQMSTDARFSGDGATVSYDELSAENQQVYDKANYYDPTSDALIGATESIGDLVGFVQDGRGVITKFKKLTPLERANVIANLFAAGVKAIASFSNFVAQSEISANKAAYLAGEMETSTFGKRTVKVAGKEGLVDKIEDYSATEVEQVSMAMGMISGGVNQLIQLKDALVKFVKWCGKLHEQRTGDEEHSKLGLVREGADSVKSFGSVAKSTLDVAMKTKTFFEGASGVAVEALPGIGLVLNAIEIVKRGIDIAKAKRDAKSVKGDKASGKAILRGRWSEPVLADTSPVQKAIEEIDDQLAPPKQSRKASDGKAREKKASRHKKGTPEKKDGSGKRTSGTAGAAAPSTPPAPALTPEERVELQRERDDLRHVVRGFNSAYKGKEVVHQRVRERRAALVELQDLLERRAISLDSGDQRALDTELAVIDDYLLDRDLANTANKRRDRAILAIINESMSIAGNCAKIAGQLHVSTAFSLSSTLSRLGATGLRTLKQFNRDHDGPMANENKTTEKKNERYAEIAERIYSDYLSIHDRYAKYLKSAGRTDSPTPGRAVELAIRTEAAAARSASGGPSEVVGLDYDCQKLKGRVKAAGLSWGEFCNQQDPAARFAMLLFGQKKRE